MITENPLEKIRLSVNKATTNQAVDELATSLQAKNDDLIPELSKLFKKHNSIGFATFGEQHNGVHVNQTFTGIAIDTQPCAG